MTTRVTIKNEPNSNGDIHIVKSSGFGNPIRTTLNPGDPAYDEWISTGTILTVQETWPTVKPHVPSREEVATDDLPVSSEPSVGLTD